MAFVGLIADHRQDEQEDHPDHTNRSTFTKVIRLEGSLIRGNGKRGGCINRTAASHVVDNGELLEILGNGKPDRSNQDRANGGQNDMPESLVRIAAIYASRLNQGLVHRLQSGKDHHSHIRKLLPDTGNHNGDHCQSRIHGPGKHHAIGDPSFHKQVIDDTVLLLEHPSPYQRNDNRGDRPGDQHHTAENSSAADFTVQQQGYANAEHQLDANSEDNEYKGVSEIGKKIPFLEQGDIVLQTNPGGGHQIPQAAFTEAGPDAAQNRNGNYAGKNDQSGGNKGYRNSLIGVQAGHEGGFTEGRFVFHVQLLSCRKGCPAVSCRTTYVMF